jgi:hypothetical protein
MKYPNSSLMYTNIYTTCNLQLASQLLMVRHVVIKSCLSSLFTIWINLVVKIRGFRGVYPFQSLIFKKISTSLNMLGQFIQNYAPLK